MAYVIISSGAGRILQKQVLESVEFAEPRFRTREPMINIEFVTIDADGT